MSKPNYMELVPDILKETPGLTRHEIIAAIAAKTGTTLKPTSLRLGELGLLGKIRVEKQKKEVPVIKETEVFFAAS